MSNLLENLKIKIRGDNITLPESRNIGLIVYSVLIIAAGIGIVHTLMAFMGKNDFISNKISNDKAQINFSQQKRAINVDEYDAIIKRNIFNIAGTVPDASDDNDNVCTTELKKSTLAYNVSGIIYGGSASTSIVLLEENSANKNLVFKLGDTIVPGKKISDITINKVFIAGKGCPEYLEINYPSPQMQRRFSQKGGNSNIAYSENGFERIGNTTNVTKQWVNDILSNKLSSVLEQARAVPYLVGGQVKGFTVTQIVSDSVYSKLGLKNGDVVSSINGIELNDAARAIQTLNSLRSESKIDLGIIRDGQPVSLKVNVQ